MGTIVQKATRIGPKHQVTIPKEVFKTLQLEVGDYLDVRAAKGRIVMRPGKLVSKEDAWFFSKEWQKKEQEADAAIKRGEVSGPFSTVRDLMGHLQRHRTRAKKIRR